LTSFVSSGDYIPMVTYNDLDVGPLVNAWGTVTVVGGSLMDPEVVAAMEDAARSFVSLPELLKKSGDYVARRLGVEAAFVCSGAAAGLAISAAACIAGADEAMRARLPRTRGRRRDIIVLRPMRSRYEQVMASSGARLVRIGTSRKTEIEEIEDAIGDRTAAVCYFVEGETPGMPGLEEVVTIAHRHGIPVIVDAAAEIPPTENLWHYWQLGVDLTVFSGGKALRGPQCSGLIVGRRDLIDACAYNAAPNHSIGRSMKIGKEEVIGLVTAIDRFVSRDSANEREGWEAVVEQIRGALTGMVGVSAVRIFPGERGIQPTCIPRVLVTWDRRAYRVGVAELREDLLRGEPRVATGWNQKGLIVNPQTLQSGESGQVIDAISTALNAHRVAGHHPRQHGARPPFGEGTGR